jgi:hypothetical protein
VANTVEGSRGRRAGQAGRTDCLNLRPRAVQDRQATVGVRDRDPPARIDGEGPGVGRRQLADAIPAQGEDPAIGRVDRHLPHGRGDRYSGQDLAGGGIDHPDARLAGVADEHVAGLGSDSHPRGAAAQRDGGDCQPTATGDDQHPPTAGAAAGDVDAAGSLIDRHAVRDYVERYALDV